jgi:hypothetical protein
MGDLCGLIWCAMAGLFRSRAALQAEILVLRHQLNVLRRKSPKRVVVGDIDRLLFCGLYRLSPKVLDALKIFQPETVIRWHRAGFRAYWRWRSGPRGGRPKTPADIRQLILEMSVANPLWGAPRIHGELLKLGIDVGQTTGPGLRRGRLLGPKIGLGRGSAVREHAPAARLARCYEIIDPDRKPPDPHSGGVPDRIGHRPGAAGDADLADALDAQGVHVRIVFLDGQDVHRGDVGVNRHVILRKIGIHNSAGAAVDHGYLM